MSAYSLNHSLSEMLIDHCDSSVSSFTRQRASLHFLDWLGCILVGQATEAGRSLRQYSQTYTPSSGSAFNATGASMHVLDAAFINGGLGNILEMDDLHRQSLLHTGDTVMPAALAVAQQTSASMEQFLNAIVKGYEVAIQIGLIAASSGYSAWYNSSTCGVFGAGMAASELLNLDKIQTRDALGQCGMMASGLWQCRLEQSNSKQLATANAARSGVMAAMLASNDFPGPKKILEGELGFFKTLYPNSDSTSLIESTDGSWKINEVSFKPWPACRHTHPAIEAAMALASSIKVNDISSIEIASYRSGLDFCNNRMPVSDHEARFSLQYCVATTLLRGNPELEHFNSDARADKNVQALINVTHLMEDSELQQAFPKLFGGRVTVKLRNGDSYSKTVSSAKGDPENPMSLKEIRNKFSDLCSVAGIEDSTIKAVLENLSDKTTLGSLSTLSAQLNDITNQLEQRRHAT